MAKVVSLVFCCTAGCRRGACRVLHCLWRVQLSHCHVCDAFGHSRFTVCDEGPTTRPPVELKGINHLDSLPGQGPINHVAGKYDAEISGLEQDVAALQQSLAIYP